MYPRKTMKKPTFVALIALLFNTGLFAGTTIISDLDDTIKIINSDNYVTISYHALLKNRFFTGMPEFLEESRTYSEKLHVVSGSPKLIGKKIAKSLKSKNIQYESIILRRFKEMFESKYDFKVRKIREMIESTDDSIIFLGDDVSHDPEVYDLLVKSYPDRILAGYIHVIKNRPIPETMIPHWSSFELAVREYEAGRMKKESVHKISEVILNETRMERIIPGFAHCPKDLARWDWTRGTLFSEEAIKVSEKIVNYCTI